MRIPRIYTSEQLVAGAHTTLGPQASHHLVNVLRMKQGNAITLFNGDGYEYPATLISNSKKSVTVAVEAGTENSKTSPLAIHLGIAISRGERMDHVIQKATELGVSEITPLFTERTEVKLKGERQQKKQQHWQQIVIHACEQCGRNTLPLIHTPTNILPWVEQVQAEKKWVLHHRTDETLNPTDKLHTAALLIGPEGGLSQPEIEQAEHNDFKALCLGPRVLRTETAPLAAITVLQYVWGDIA